MRGPCRKPPLTRETSEPLKSRKRKKFILERRCVTLLPHDDRMSFLNYWYERQREWHIYRRYDSEKAREKAREMLEKRTERIGNITIEYEYRFID